MSTPNSSNPGLRYTDARMLHDAVFNQLRAMNPSVGHEEAARIAHSCEESTKPFFRLLAHGGHVPDPSIFFKPYTDFEKSHDAELIRKARLQHLQHAKTEFARSLKETEEEALMDYKNLLSDLHVFLALLNGVYKNFPGSDWISADILRYYSHFLEGTLAKLANHVISVEEDNKVKDRDLLLATASLTPKGRIIAEYIKKIQIYTNIIATHYKLENLEAFREWIGEHAPLALNFVDYFAEKAGGHGSIFGWTALVHLHTPSEHGFHLINKSLAHSRYFPRARSTLLSTV